VSARFAYGLTRVHARIAERPGAETRKRLASVDDFGHFLQLATRSGFGNWLTHLGPASDVHAVELALRATYRSRVRELATWLPLRWRSAVEWLRVAPDLPVLSDLLLRGRRADWIARFRPRAVPRARPSTHCSTRRSRQPTRCGWNVCFGAAATRRFACSLSPAWLGAISVSCAVTWSGAA
jgi:hypothetical protein